MVQQNGMRMLSEEDLEKERKLIIEGTIKHLLDSKILMPYTSKLRINDIAKKYNISRAMVQKWTERKTNPLIMEGNPKTAEAEYVEKWYKNNSGDYQLK